MGRESIVEIGGHKYRYEYEPESRKTVYKGPVGDAPELTEEQFFAMATQEPALSEEECWAIIDEIGWGTKTTDSDAVKKMLMKRLTPEEANAFFWHVQLQQGQISHALKQEAPPDDDDEEDEWGFPDTYDEKIELGGDGFGDLLSHIVGLGKAEVERSVANPQLVVDRAERREFTESFSYVIPHDSDYELTSLSGFKKRIDDNQEEYSLAKNDYPPNFHDDFDLILKSLDTLEDGNIDRFLATKEQGIAAAKNISENWKVRTNVHGGAVGNEWALINLYTDVEYYLKDDEEPKSKPKKKARRLFDY
jgi:hypothetical protein